MSREILRNFLVFVVFFMFFLDNISMNFSDRIEILMAEKKVSKVELAKYANITTQTFYDWKKKGSVPSADVAVKIAEYLNTSVEFLVTGTEKDSYKGRFEKLVKDMQGVIDKA